MTIEKGAPWGAVATTPFGVVVAPNEESLARAIAAGAAHVVLESGDLLRALGTADPRARVVPGGASLQLPCDMLRVTLDHRDPIPAVGSVVIGSVFRPRAWIATGGFLGSLNVAPRAHPNDGLVDVLEFAASMPPRQLLAIRRRMRRGDHLPHPQLAMQRTKEYVWNASTSGGRRAPVMIDGRRYGRAHNIRIEVQPDAFVLCVPNVALG